MTGGARDFSIRAEASIKEETLAQRDGSWVLGEAVRRIWWRWPGRADRERAQRTEILVAPNVARVRGRADESRNDQRGGSGEDDRAHSPAAHHGSLRLKRMLSGPGGPSMVSFTTHQPLMLNFMPSTRKSPL